MRFRAISVEDAMTPSAIIHAPISNLVVRPRDRLPSGLASGDDWLSVEGADGIKTTARTCKAAENGEVR